MGEKDNSGVQMSQGAAPAELTTPRGDIDQYGMGGSSPQDTANVLAAAMRDAARKLGPKATQAEIDAEAGRIASGYIYGTIVPQQIAKVFGKGAAEAYGKLAKSHADLQNKAGETSTDVFMRGWNLIQQTQNTANDEYRKRFSGHQDSIISGAINAKMQPYQAMASLGNLSVFFGGIMQFIGTASNNEKWANMGASMMTTGIEMGQRAGDAIMALDKEKKMADATRKAPDDWNPKSVTFNVTPEMSQLAKEYGIILDAALARRHLDRTKGAIDGNITDPLAGYNSRRGGLTYSGPVVRRSGPIALVPIGAEPKFDQAHTVVAQNEGGYANNPADRGGPTIYGIASRFHPDAFAQVMALEAQGKQDEAKGLARGYFHEQFWKPVVKPEMNGIQALVTYDMAVNHGPDVATDIYKRAKGDPQKMLELRGKLYDQIIDRDPSQAVFRQGWDNRRQTLAEYAKKYEKDQTLAAAAVPAKQDSRHDQEQARRGRPQKNADAGDHTAHDYVADASAADLARRTLEKAKGGTVAPVQRDFTVAVHAPKPSAGGDVVRLDQSAELHARAEATEGTDNKKKPTFTPSPLAIFMEPPSLRMS